MKRYLVLFIVLIVFIFMPNFSIAGENPERCDCWRDGYDAQKSGYPISGDGPGGTKDDCDLIGLKDEWEVGWKAAKNKKKRECPYYE